MARYTLLVFTCLTVALGANWAHSTAQAATETVTNGGFESGQAPWQESTLGGYQLIDPSRPHTGTHSVWLCGVNSCNDQIWQTVTLPTNLTQAVLSYWVYSDTQEAAGAGCNDSLTARLRTSGGSTITTIGTVCNSNTGWTQKTVDVTSALASYSGQSVEVAFQGTTNASLPSDFFVDDVTVTAGTAGGSGGTASATATPTPTKTPAPVATYTPTPVPTVSSGSCTGTSSQSACMQAMLTILNSDRAAHGVAPLTLNLTESNGTSSCVGSYGHSVHMQQMGQISHDQFPGDICIPYYTAGENVGDSNTGSIVGDLQNMENMMMAEPYTPGCSGSHVCNILSSGYSQVGIGVYRDSSGTTWLTQDFTN
jgi:uncharacterized protein YkwD